MSTYQSPLSDPTKSRERLPIGLDPTGMAVFSDILKSIASLPGLGQQLSNLGHEIAALKEEVRNLQKMDRNDDAWLDTKAAAKHLSLSANTFEKYHRHTTPRIPGYRVGGKTLFKREDLDSFVKLYDVKSRGLA